MKKKLFLILIAFVSTSLFAEQNDSSVKEEIIENTVDLSSEVIELNQKAIRNIASEDENIDRLDSNDVQFWFIDQN